MSYSFSSLFFSFLLRLPHFFDSTARNAFSCEVSVCSLLQEIANLSVDKTLFLPFLQTNCA
ncbi:hypothetical protein [Citrobacter pasteurii]|nr:hypothetical protein [Citrobacter pasteurii]